MSSDDIYQDFILELYKHPLNAGTMEKPDYTAKSHNPLCGDKIELFLKMSSDGKVADVKFKGDGCAISQATISLLTVEIKGKTLEELARFQKEDILRIIQIDLSRNASRLKCALLSLEVLKKAISAKKA